MLSSPANTEAADGASRVKGIYVEPVARSIKSPGSQATAPGATANFGLFVGVNEFKRDAGLQSLEFAVNDAIAQAHMFVCHLEMIEASNCWLAVEGTPNTEEAKAKLAELVSRGVRQHDASKSAILSSLLTVCNLPREARDMVVVSLSSHGFEAENRAYVMPSDGMCAILSDTAVDLSTIEQRLQDSKAGKRLLLVDACREKATKETKGTGQVMSEAFRQALEQCKGQVVLASCAPGQVSLENKQVGQGIFTYFLLKALQGEAEADTRGFITVERAAKYISTEVQAWMRRERPQLEDHKIQKPWFKGEEEMRDLPLGIKKEVLMPAIEEITDKVKTALNTGSKAFDLAKVQREIAQALEKAPPSKRAQASDKLSAILDRTDAAEEVIEHWRKERRQHGFSTPLIEANWKNDCLTGLSDTFKNNSSWQGEVLVNELRQAVDKADETTALELLKKMESLKGATDAGAADEFAAYWESQRAQHGFTGAESLRVAIEIREYCAIKKGFVTLTNRFERREDGIYDKYLNGLWISTGQDKIFKWKEAKALADAKGATLPKIEELKTLITKDQSKSDWGLINSKFFPVNTRANGKFWTLSKYDYVDFNTGRDRDAGTGDDSMGVVLFKNLAVKKKK